MIERRRRILVVEDDAALASMYRSALRFAGFDVQLATDGMSALWAIDQATPDLVVLDLHLPRLRGEAILSELSANPALQHIPVVVVTGSDAQAAVAQASAILRKPCAPDTLLAVIEEHLDPAA
jgi:DNA-binding response OmpR family regulator